MTYGTTNAQDMAPESVQEELNLEMTYSDMTSGY
jgi:hypothetical protein